VNMFCCVTEDDPNAIYVYSFFWSGNKKIQESWSRWTFPTKVRYIHFIESYLYVVTERYPDSTATAGSGLRLLKLRLGDTATATEGTYNVHLDRRITEAKTTARIYDPDTDLTKIYLPYEIGDVDTFVVMTRKDSPAAVDSLILSQVTPANGDESIVVKGDHSVGA